jgi:hypothetical protein
MTVWFSLSHPDNAPGVCNVMAHNYVVLKLRTSTSCLLADQGHLIVRTCPLLTSDGLDSDTKSVSESLFANSEISSSTSASYVFTSMTILSWNP